jgi:hypothetical protein
MCASSSRVRAEPIGLSVARIGCEFVTIGDRGEGLAIQCGRICVGVGVGEIEKQRSWRVDRRSSEKLEGIEGCIVKS